MLIFLINGYYFLFPGKGIVITCTDENGVSGQNIMENGRKEKKENSKRKNPIRDEKKPEKKINKLKPKKLACYFCIYPYKNQTIDKDYGMYLNFARHLKTAHKSEPEVQAARKKKDLQERRHAFSLIANEGSTIRNLMLLSGQVSGETELVLGRRPSEEAGENDDFMPCPYCHKWLQKKNLFLHAKGSSCKPREEGEQKRAVLKESRKFLYKSLKMPHFDIENDKEYGNFSSGVLDRLAADKISETIFSDELILWYGLTLYKNYRDKQSDMIRQRMRVVARLLQVLKRMEDVDEMGEDPGLWDFMRPKFFEKLVEATLILSECDRSSMEVVYGKEGIAKHMGGYLKCIVGIKQSFFSKNEDLQNEHLMNSLQNTIERDWTRVVSGPCLRASAIRKAREHQVLPLTSDLSKLGQFLKAKIIELIPILEEQKSLECWEKLATLTLARVIFFNRKRSGEASRMLLSDFTSDINYSEHEMEESLNRLSKFEKDVMARNRQIKIIGKRGRVVPVLITTEANSAIETLIKFRKSEQIGKL